LRKSDSFVKTKCSPSPQCYIARGLASSREEMNEREKNAALPLQKVALGESRRGLKPQMSVALDLNHEKRG
jgi:hypothetical protein